MILLTSLLNPISHIQNSQRSLGWILILALILSGCVTSKGLTPIAQPKDLRQLGIGQTIAQVEGTINWPNEEWWTQYQDPQLNQLVEHAIRDNPTLHAARARIMIAQSFADSMKAQTLPSLGANAQVSRERFTALQFIPPPWAGSVDWNNQVTASVSYDLDLWNGQKNSWLGSIDQAKAVAADARQVQLLLETAIVREYIQFSLLHNMHDVAIKRMALIKQRLSIAQRAHAAGLENEAVVLEIETTLPVSQGHLDAIDENLTLVRNQLAALVGQGPAAGEILERPSLTLSAPVGVPAQLPANLVAKRPDIVANRWHIEASGKQIESAKAAFFPNINLVAFAGFQALGFGQLLSSAGQIAGVGPAISLPLFDGGRRRSQLAMQDAVQDLSVDQYNASLVQALHEVSDQLVKLKTNAAQQMEATTAIELATKSHSLAIRSYRAGIDNYQHVLDTQAALLNHEEAMMQLQAKQMDAYAGLMKALGGGIMEGVPALVPPLNTQVYESNRP